jgi:hypothetical protein
VKDVFWTLGEYDIVSVVEAPYDISITALGLSTGALGNVRTRREPVRISCPLHFGGLSAGLWVAPRGSAGYPGRSRIQGGYALVFFGPAAAALDRTPAPGSGLFWPQPTSKPLHSH